MSWSIYGIRKANNIVDFAKKNNSYPLAEPEESIRAKIIEILQLVADSNTNFVVSVEASGSMSYSYGPDNTVDTVTNHSLNVKIQTHLLED